MNLEKARETYQHDPEYHHLVDILMQQIATLKLSPSEIREAAMFACITIEERSMHPLMMINFAEMELQHTARLVQAGRVCKECYRVIKPSKDGLCICCLVTKADASQAKRVMLICKECHEAMLPGSVCGVCNRCTDEIAEAWL